MLTPLQATMLNQFSILLIPPTPLYIIYMIYTYMYIRIRNNLCLRHRNRQMSLGSDLFTFIMGTTLINFTSLVWMFVWACFPTFVISWYAQWSFDHCLHHHLSKITSFLSNGQHGADSILWRRFKTILQLLNNKLSKNIFTNHEILN